MKKENFCFMGKQKVCSPLLDQDVSPVFWTKATVSLFFTEWRWANSQSYSLSEGDRTRPERKPEIEQQLQKCTWVSASV